MRRTGAVLMILTMLALVPAGAAGAVAPHDRGPAALADRSRDGTGGAVPVERVAGPGRVETAVAASVRGWPDGADTALLATAAAFPDALAAGGLAAALDAPLLLTAGAGLPDGVADELVRLDPDQVIVLGGPGAVPEQAEDDIRALPGAPEARRLAGTTRFDTAALIAAEAGAPSGQLAVASGETFPDALSAASLTASPDRLPTLLTGATDLPPPTGQLLVDLEPDRALVLGGTGAVSAGVVDEVARLGPDVGRIAGDGRFATSQAIVAEALERFDGTPRPLLVATGADFPDALAAGALAASLDGPLLLVPGDGLTPDLDAFVRANRTRFSRGVVMGGPGAVSDTAVAELAAALADAPPPAPPEPEVPPLQLRTDGLGGVPFGASYEDGIRVLEHHLGPPLFDTGWRPIFEIQPCPHEEGRALEWPGLYVVFTRNPTPGSQVPPGLAQWWAYPGDAASGLTTVPGIGIGDSNAALRIAYPDVVFDDTFAPEYWDWFTDYREPDLGPVRGWFGGWTYDPSDAGIVEGMYAITCGETV